MRLARVWIDAGSDPASGSLMANVPRDKLDEVRKVIPGLSGPTIVEVLDSGSWVAAHAVVDAKLVYQTISRLKALGAEGVLVTKIERLMP